MSKNKQKNQSENSEVKHKNRFLTKKNLSLALLVFVLGTGAFYGIKDELTKSAVSSAVISVSDSQIPGWWLQQYFGASVCSNDNCKSESDPDLDKLTNTQEFFYHSNPTDKDTNKNGLDDGQDVANNFDPSKPGKVTFDELVTDESILGESLVFDSDLQALINEAVDPNNVQLPTVNELELKITNDNSAETVRAYLDANKKIIAKYLPANVGNYIGQIAASPDPESIELVRAKCVSIITELKNITVPSEFVQMHKYNIMLFDLLPDVVNVPDSSQLQNEFDSTSNAWFDKTQALMTVYQKIDLESKRLQTKF